MKRKLNPDNQSNKKLKTIDNHQKIKDIRRTLDITSFDNRSTELKKKLSELDDEKEAYIASYYLKKLGNKDIDYVFFNSYKNLSDSYKINFKITQIDYWIHFEACFNSDRKLKSYKLTQVDLYDHNNHKKLFKHLKISTYDDLLAVSCFDKEGYDIHIKNIVDNGNSENKIVVNDIPGGNTKICGRFQNFYYIVERK
jgi:hypothetical protein